MFAFDQSRDSRRQTGLTAPRKIAAFCSLMLALGTAHAVSYSYLTPTYSTVTSYNAPCSGGSCATFTTAMQLQGTFTTATALAPNLANAETASLVTTYAFSDGLTSYSSADALSRLFRLSVSTDAAGAITSLSLTLQKWHGNPPHGVNARYDQVMTSLTVTDARHNLQCNVVGTSPFSGIADSCNVLGFDLSMSIASANASAPPVASSTSPVSAPNSVPTLAETALLSLIALLGLSGAAMTRKVQ